MGSWRNSDGFPPLCVSIMGNHIIHEELESHIQYPQTGEQKKKKK